MRAHMSLVLYTQTLEYRTMPMLLHTHTHTHTHTATSIHVELTKVGILEPGSWLHIYPVSYLIFCASVSYLLHGDNNSICPAGLL